MIIALDGPAAAGKGTLAQRLAAHFDLALLDTGRLYRAVGRRVLEAGEEPGDPAAAERAARSLTAGELERPGLRAEAVSRAASQVAAHPGVRLALLQFQRDFAHHPPGGRRGAILDGRDIGTVICPDADVKIFLNASLEARAERRYQELRAAGSDIIKARVLADMQERDARDSAREAAPLTPAPDAFQLDTTHLDADQVFQTVIGFIGRKLESRGA